MFQLFDPVPLIEKAPRWAAKVARNYPNVFGLSPFAHLFVSSADASQIAIIVIERPELVELKSSSIEEFRSTFLCDPNVLQTFFRSNDVAVLAKRLGALEPDQCYFPAAYRSIGGSGDLDTYCRGDAWVHLDIYAQTIGI